MKKIYFSIDNGEIRDPSILAPYYALVDKGRVKEVYMLFSIENIRMHDKERLKSIIQDKKDVFDIYQPDLMRKLTFFVNQMKFWGKSANYTEENYDRFVYLRFI